MRGIVIRATGSWYEVRLEDGAQISCRIKGKIRLEDRRSTNPVVIGDEVEVEFSEDDKMITKIFPRTNYIIRQSPKHRTAEHIIAANLDLAVVIATINYPRTSTGFIDRMLVTTTAYHIPAILVVNKSDLYNKDELKQYDELKSIYDKIGYPTILISAKKDEGVDLLKDFILNRVSVFSGHSGVGKSTLLNELIPKLELHTKEISDYTGKGQHATTYAEMYALPFGGFIIDTPGIKEFGVLDLVPQEISHYFPEMRDKLQGCKFNNCLHLNEPGCAIRESVENGEIAESRYKSYQNILEETRSREKIYD